MANLLSALRRLFRDQQGAALLTLTLAISLASAVIVPAVLTYTTVVATGRTRLPPPKDYYARDSGIEHGIWRLRYENGFAASLTPSNPSAQYQITLNGVTTTVTVTTLETVPLESEVKIYKTVSPVTASQGTDHNFVYTITIINQTNAAVSLDRIDDNLPKDFDYVMGSSSGITGLDPAIDNAEKKLTWNLVPAVPVAAFATATQTFTAVAPSSTHVGTYSNKATAKYGTTTITTGDTAEVRIIASGNLATTVVVTPNVVDPGTAHTFTYTVTVTNYDTSSYDLKELSFWTEDGFTYVTGSSGQGCSGVTTDDPSVDSSGISPLTWRYKWILHQPYPSIPPLGSRVQCFQTAATLNRGTYYHQAEANIANLSGSVNLVNSGNTAPITVRAAFRIVAQANGRTTTAVIEVLPGAAIVYSWDPH